MVQCFSRFFVLDLTIRCICFILVTALAVHADEVQSGEYFLQLRRRRGLLRNGIRTWPIRPSDAFVLCKPNKYYPALSGNGNIFTGFISLK